MLRASRVRRPEQKQPHGTLVQYPSSISRSSVFKFDSKGSRTMRAKLLDENDGHRTYSLVFDAGEEVIRTLLTFARETDLEGSHFTAIGAFQDVVLGWFDWELKD